MQSCGYAYISKESAVHACDARVKVLLLFAATAALLCARSWTGMALGLLGTAAVMAAARLSALRLLSRLKPLYAILAFTILFGSLTGAAGEAGMGAYGYGPRELATAAMAPLPLGGTVFLSPAGFETALFNALRILLMALLSLVVSFSTTSNALTDALRALLRPLGRLRVPVDDVATALSMAVRFIPVLSEQLARTRDAQLSRGAKLSEDGPIARASAWGRVLVPLFVGLFRRAERLAVAMEARCYGAGGERTSLQSRAFSLRDGLALAGGVLACSLVAFC